MNEAQNLIKNCLNKHKKYGKHGELLLIETLKPKYTPDSYLYDEILNTLVDNIVFRLAAIYHTKNENGDLYTIRQFCYEVSVFDSLYYTIKNRKILFFDELGKALNSDYLINYGKDLDINNAQLLTKDEIFSSFYRWNYIHDEMFEDMLGNEGRIHMINIPIPIDYKKKDFRDIDIENLIKNKLKK